MTNPTAITPIAEASIVAFLQEQRPDDRFDADTRLFSSGRIDSTGLIGLVAFLERTFNFEVGPADITLENFDTVNAVVAFVRNRAAG